MRILTVSNIYPPDYLGGYELHCAQAVDGLRRRGHHVEVLTVESAMPEPDPLVHRALRWHPPPPRRESPRWEARRLLTYLANLRAARRVTRRLRPDVVMCWSPARVGLVCLVPASSSGTPIALFADDWSLVTEWQLTDPDRAPATRPSRRAAVAGLRAPLRLLRRRLAFSHLVAVSGFVERTYRDLAFPVGETSVIHQGARFPLPPLDRLPEGEPDRLLFTGRVERIKGVHLAIEVLHRLHRDHDRTRATLTIVGRPSTEDPSYRAELDRQVEGWGLSGHVTFAGSKSQAELFDLLPRHRLLLFTSLWEEPGPATTIEALGHGLPVVTTDAGGMPEYVRDGVDGFVVPRQQPGAMAAAADRLLGDDELWRQFRAAGWERVRTHFSDERFLREVDAVLGRLAGSAPGATGRRRARDRWW